MNAIAFTLILLSLRVDRATSYDGYDGVNVEAEEVAGMPELDVHAFVSKVEETESGVRNKAGVTTDIDGWSCECYYPSTDAASSFDELECKCYGKKFRTVPRTLGNNLTRLTVMDSEMVTMRRDSLQPYKSSITDVTLSHLPHLKTIESGTFANLDRLRTIYISHAASLTRLDGLFSGTTTEHFYSLRVVHSALEVIPDFKDLHLQMDNVINMIELEKNQIETLPSNALKVVAADVILNYNQLERINGHAFNGSQIGKLSFRGNYNLKSIDKHAFSGVKSLTELDLSDTSIRKLPTDGLGNLEVLKIQNTASMKTIPSIYQLKNLKKAFLTHSFHCCAYKYPKQHDPVRFESYQKALIRFCETGVGGTIARTKRQSFEGDGDGLVNYASNVENPGRPFSPNPEHTKGHPNNTDHSHLKPLNGKTIERYDRDDLDDYVENVDDDEWSDEPMMLATNGTTVEALCGNFVVPQIHVVCRPEPNALNPCEDMMGSNLLRVSVWFVLVLAIVGNVAVIVVALFSGGELSVSRFLICNLAFADICMGIYLLLIASMDVHSIGYYFNAAYDWQYGVGCKVSGFLTVFSSHLSVFTLTVITLERWFAIAHAIYLTRRIHLNSAIKIMCAGWIYSLAMASLPLFGASNYSSTSICLPMEANEVLDKVYLFLVILINGVAFALIVFCYGQIYFSLTYETRHNKGEGSIAKKMALLVFTDFVCWAPIAFFSLTALAGYPLIGVTESKILLVFFYPLNSCANPYLYAIMTSQYRKDLYLLLSRFGLCKGRLRRCTMNTSLPTLNNGHPTPLLTKNNP